MATVEMKFVLIFTLLVFAKCTSGKKKGKKGDKGDPGASCKCNLHPSAHIEAANLEAVTYQANEVIKDWSVSAPYSHLARGMKYNDGNLTVPKTGRYYIYAQMYYHNNGRIEIRVNNNAITMIQPPAAKADQGTLYTGGVYNLKAGDVITLSAVSSARVYMYTIHCFFGAYLI